MTDVEPRSIVAIARKDFDDARRSKLIWVLGALFVLIFGGMAALPLVFAELLDLGRALFQNFSTEQYVRLLQGPISWFFPVIGLLLGYKSIVGETESGTGRIMHTLPHSRLDVVIGKFAGRTVVLWATLAIGLLLALVVAVGFYDTAEPVTFVRFALLSMLYAASWVSIGVGVSALTRSTSLAMALAIGTFLFFYFVYDALRFGLVWIVEGQLPLGAMGGGQPTWYVASGLLTPGSAYTLTLPRRLARDAPGGGNLPEYLVSPEAGLIILAVWIVLPLAVGYLRFQRMDL